MFVVKVIALFIASATGMNEQKNSISIIVSVPLYDCIGSQDINSKRGQEILTAAQAAVNGINNDSSILSKYDLQLLLFNSCKEEYETIQQFMNITYYLSSHNARGLTGFFSHEAISLLLPLVKHQRTVMTLPSEIFVYRNYYGNSFLSTNSPTTMATILITFVKSMNWERVGLITESTDSYFFNVAASLLRIANVNKTVVISPYIELRGLESAIHETVRYNTKVILISLPAQRVAQMICLIERMGLLWPDYAWIFHSHEIEDYLDQATNCDMEKAISGIFMIESQIKPNHLETKLASNFTCFEHDLSDTKPDFLANNTLAHVVSDLVLLTAIKLNQSSGYQSNTSQVNIQDPTTYEIIYTFSILHLWGRSKVITGKIYSNLSITILNETVMKTAPKDDLPISTSIDPPIGYTIGIAFLIVFLASFVTLTLILYIFFRKQPEIKASSFTISLFQFAGCYLNLLYIAFLVYFDNPAFNTHSIQHQNTVCHLLQWLSGSGISLPLMLATLLVKMLRVYHIFNYVTLGVARYCSDLALIVYIILILAPAIIVNLVWLLADPYHALVEHKTRKGYIELSKDCNSKYESIWSGVLSAYLLLLTLASAIVAIMTRKVRLQHFKDTKKVNILVFTLGFGIILTFSYWLLLQMLNTKPYIVSVPLIIGHSIVVLSFQVLLFTPKVFPPLWRCIKQKHHQLDTTVHKSIPGGACCISIVK